MKPGAIITGDKDIAPKYKSIFFCFLRPKSIKFLEKVFFHELFQKLFFFLEILLFMMLNRIKK